MSSKKEIRQFFVQECLKRDKHSCKICNAANVKLDVHHIMDRNYFPNGGYIKENGITLCETCHLLAEKYHMSNGQTYHTNMHPDDLYNIINSSFEIAIHKDGELQ